MERRKREKRRKTKGAKGSTPLVGIRSHDGGTLTQEVKRLISIYFEYKRNGWDRLLVAGPHGVKGSTCKLLFQKGMKEEGKKVGVSCAVRRARVLPSIITPYVLSGSCVH